MIKTNIDNVEYRIILLLFVSVLDLLQSLITILN